MKLYFFGTPDFAIPSLKVLSIDPSFKILGVVTQPDRPGDKNKITKPPVKELAETLNLPILQPEKIDKTLIEEIKASKPDAIVVVAYGELIPKELLEIPKYGCINIHPSLLPKYRGASPIQEALLNGDETTGVAFMKLDKDLDHGDIFLIKRVEIDKTDNFESLSKKLSAVAALLLPLVLKDIENEIFPPIPQNHKNATFCSKIDKKDGELNFTEPSAKVLNKIRALNPWPGTFTKIKDKTLKILEAHKQELSKTKPGTFELLDKKTFAIHTKDALIIPTKVQLQGKKVVTAEEFLNGYKNLFL